MWPTFYIPSLLAPGVGNVGGGCGEGTAANSYTVTLSGADFNFRAGDFVWVFVETAPIPGNQRVTSSKDINLLFGGKLSGTPNRPVWDKDTTSGTTACQSQQPLGVAWRRWTSLDESSPLWTFTSSSTPFRVCVYGVRNIHADDPLPVFWRNPNSDSSDFTSPSGTFGCFWAPIPYFDGTIRFDFAFEGIAGSSYTILNSEIDMPVGSDVLLAVKMNAPAITTENESEGLISFVARRTANGEGNNLLPNSDLSVNGTPGAGWTSINTTVSKVTVSDVDVVNLQGTRTVGQPCQLYRDVTLAPNKVYFWCAAMGSGTPGHIHRSIGYEIGGVYSGIAHTVNVSELIEITNSPKYVFGHHLYDTIGQQRQQDLYGLYLGPFEEETTVRLYFGLSDNSGRLFTSTGSTANMSVSYVGLHEVPDSTCIPTLVGTSATAVSGTNATYGRTLGLWPYKQTIATINGQSIGVSVGFAGLMRNASAAPITVDIRHWNKDPKEWPATSATQFRRLKDVSHEWSIGSGQEMHGKAWAHPRMALPGLGRDKFYFEATVTTWDGGSTADDRPMVYINSAVAAWSAQNAPQSAIPTGASSILRAGYCANGKIVEEGAITSGYATWGLGDIIGVAVDLSAETIDWYKNGSLIRSTPMPTGMKLYPLQAEIVSGRLSASTALVAFSINFTGPFSGRKPSGFYAWDWPNEVP